MKQLRILSVYALAALLTNGISLPAQATSKKMKKAQAQIASLEKANRELMVRNKDCRDTTLLYLSSIQSLKDQNERLSVQLKDQRTTNEQVLNHLKDLSVISGAQAESINKFLETMGAKDAYIRDLQSAMARKDSMNVALVVNLKSAIGNIDDKDINIKIDKGVVYVDISDKMLFKTGKYDITDRAKEVLGKVARVLTARPDIEFMVEGHTDNVPFHEGVLTDNWDLSVKRATTVVRLLQSDYGIQPSRMTAAGRSEYVPLTDNNTLDGKAANRRTRIVILPQLDQFFTLIAKPAK